MRKYDAYIVSKDDSPLPYLVLPINLRQTTANIHITTLRLKLHRTDRLGHVYDIVSNAHDRR